MCEANPFLFLFNLRSVCALNLKKQMSCHHIHIYGIWYIPDLAQGEIYSHS